MNWDNQEHVQVWHVENVLALVYNKVEDVFTQRKVKKRISRFEVRDQPGCVNDDNLGPVSCLLQKGWNHSLAVDIEVCW